MTSCLLYDAKVLIFILLVSQLANARELWDYTGADRSISVLQSDGVVRNRNNVQIGRIQSDGVVRDRNNVQIGSAKGIQQEWAAAMFFFFFN